jgi:dipeptide/tripeptide permease
MRADQRFDRALRQGLAVQANGFASVIGSLITLFVAVSYGFLAVFILALVGYAVATVLASTWRVTNRAVSSGK